MFEKPFNILFLIICCRCIDYRWQRGGNASNNCTVLSKLGSNSEFFGTLSADHHLIFLQDDMRKYSIDFSHCPLIQGIGCPMSTVILSLAGGTRTILHYNPSLPELVVEDFEKLNLDDYSWIHFEVNFIFYLTFQLYFKLIKIILPNPCAIIQFLSKNI